VYTLQGALVDVLNGETALQHLDKDLPKLPGGEVVKERVEDGAEVEEGVGHRVKSYVAPEVGHGPVGLGHGGRHQASNLVGQPADHKGPDDETCR
uniref:Uncharacterized protein n=1 Tax=Myripristis murdjan TaxID=586833 RepID=A0A667ZNN4_9TELE